MGTIREREDSMAGNTSQPSIKRVWGIAKSPELKLTDEELHLLVQAHTGKDSIKALNKRELQTVIRVLGNMKDSAKKSERGRKRYSGSEVTENQRYTSSHKSLDGTSLQGSMECVRRCLVSVRLSG